MRFINLTGQRFGSLVAIGYTFRNGRAVWFCECDCGGSTVTLTTNLRSGNTKSCGCRNEANLKTGISLRHGHARHLTQSRTYTTWLSMRTRCTNPNFTAYKHYGGRGIKICERWNSFENFLADMGERPQDKSLDRIDVNGNYESSNCRWATQAEQNRNTRITKGV